jgi:NADH-quinone oxidoreductase subunit E
MSERIPVLSAGELAEIDEEILHAPYRHAVAIDALKIVQRHRGWISDESLQAIARHLAMSADELEGIATFYNLVFREPVGERVILLCNSVSCWIRGCESLRGACREHLGIDYGETTADGRYTLLPVTCLGACDKAPVLMLGEELLEDVSAEGLLARLAGSAQGGGAA